MEKLQPGQPATVELTVTNAGVAPAYQRYPAYLKLVNTATQAEHPLPLAEFDTRQWLPGADTRAVATVTVPAAVPPGRYAVRFALKREVPGQEVQPVELGLKASARQADGFYQLTEVEVK
jgi:hypothetical protein